MSSVLTGAPMRKDVNRAGIDGWLLAFILSLVVAPIYYIFDAYRFAASARYLINSGRYTESQVTSMVVLAITVAAIITVLLLWAAWRLWKDHRWNSVRLAIAVIWFVLVGIVLIDIVAGIAFAPGKWREIVALQASMFTTNLAIAFGATVYLTSARRVANTYKRSGSLGEVNDVFE